MARHSVVLPAEVVNELVAHWKVVGVGSEGYINSAHFTFCSVALDCRGEYIVLLKRVLSPCDVAYFRLTSHRSRDLDIVYDLDHGHD